jgi:hypothetical protein
MRIDFSIVDVLLTASLNALNFCEDCHGFELV